MTLLALFLNTVRSNLKLTSEYVTETGETRSQPGVLGGKDAFIGDVVRQEVSSQ